MNATSQNPTPHGSPPWRQRKTTLFLLAVTVAALAAAGAVALLVNIMERKQEARNPFYRIVELTDDDRGPGHLGQKLPIPV